MYPTNAFPPQAPLPPIRTAGPGGLAGPLAGGAFPGPLAGGFPGQYPPQQMMPPQFQGGPQFNQVVGQEPIGDQQHLFANGPFAGNPLPSGPGGNSDLAQQMAMGGGHGAPGMPAQAMYALGAGLKAIPTQPDQVAPMHMMKPQMRMPQQQPGFLSRLRGTSNFFQGNTFPRVRPY